MWKKYKVPTDAAEWLYSFIGAAETYPACIVISDMAIAGNPMFYINQEFCKVTGYAKHEAMAAVLSQLEDEKAQWDALEQEALAGASANDEASMEQMRKDVEEVNKAVEALIAAELAAENGEGGTAEELAKAVEEAERKLAMQQEGLSALVEGVEALCTRAERAAEVFSKAIAENDFKGLPHVNSRQNLVKNLVRGKKK